jgi:uncharacterized membrane protein
MVYCFSKITLDRQLNFRFTGLHFHLFTDKKGFLYCMAMFIFIALQQGYGDIAG